MVPDPTRCLRKQAYLRFEKRISDKCSLSSWKGIHNPRKYTFEDSVNRWGSWNCSHALFGRATQIKRF